MDKLMPTRWPALAFLSYQVAIIAGLAVLVHVFTGTKVNVPDYNWDHVVPLWVPLGGAVGGATISLVGVVRHSHEWDGHRYAHWHLARPVLGMITGTVAVLMLLFVLKGIAPDVIPTGDKTYTPGGIAVMFVIAFIVGYREETFRALVERVVDVILGPGEETVTQRLALVPQLLKLKGDAKGEPVTGTITLHNDTKDTFDTETATLAITGGQDAFQVVWAEQGPLAPSGSSTITVTWNPGSPPVSSDQIVTVGLGGYRLTSTVRAEAP